MKFVRLAAIALTFSQALGVSAKEVIDVSLTPVATFPEVWSLTEAQLEETFDSGENGVMRWLTTDKSRAYLRRNFYNNVELNLTLFDGKVPVQDAIIDLENGKVSLVTFSVYNRGDSGPISNAKFKELFMNCGRSLSPQLGVRPTERKASRRQGLEIEGYTWRSKAGFVGLVHNEGALDSSAPEFLRLRAANPNSRSPMAKSILARHSSPSIRLSDLPDNVQRDSEGNVFVANIPMVDQGDKGYCTVATVQRIFEYYGVGADMHQLAQISGSDPEMGTSSLQMAKEIGSIDYRFKTRLDIIGMQFQDRRLYEVDRDFYQGKEVEADDYLKKIRSSIDDGLPLLWSLKLGTYDEDPPLSEQTSGYHMRLIIGYNDRSRRLIFSDSWGSGHEFKTIEMSDAYRATTGLFTLKPTVH